MKQSALPAVDQITRFTLGHELGIALTASSSDCFYLADVTLTRTCKFLGDDP